MGMPRLINDIRRKFAIRILSIITLIVIISVYGWNKLSSINKQYYSKGMEVLDALQEKCTWLDERMNPSHDAEALKTCLTDLDKLFEQKNTITLDYIDFFKLSCEKEYYDKATILSKQCTEDLTKISELRHFLISLPSKSTNIVTNLQELSKTKAAEEIKVLTSEAKAIYSALQKKCNSPLVFLPSFNHCIEESNKITELINTNQTNNPSWKQIEEAHEDYNTINKTIENIKKQYYDLLHDLQETYQNMKSLPLHHEAVLEKIQFLNNELHKVNSLVENGTELCDNSTEQIDDKLIQFQSTIQNCFDSISTLKEQHGDYIDDKHITSITQKLDWVKTFHETTIQNITEQCLAIHENIIKIKTIQAKGLSSLNDVNNNMANEQMAEKIKEGMISNLEIDQLKTELKKSIESHSNYLIKIKATATEKTNESIELLNEIQQSLPDWNAESKKINNEIIAILNQKDRIKNDLYTNQKDIDNYRTKQADNEIKLLKIYVNEIQTILTEIDAMNITEQSCTNGKELKLQMQKRDKLKQLIANAELKSKEFTTERNRALNNSTLQRIRHVPYSSSMMDEQANKNELEFEFTFKIPPQRCYTIEIKFNKGKNTLYKISPKKEHNIWIFYTISGAKDKNEYMIMYDDTTNKPWSNSIVLKSPFSSDINHIDMHLSFIAKDISGVSLENRGWKWQFKNNFSIEVLIDGKSTPLEMCIIEQ